MSQPETKTQETISDESNITEEPLICLLGGMGPMAGILFHKILTQNTKVSKDQEHLNVIHLSLPKLISDRTGFLMDKTGKAINPGIQVANIVKNISNMATNLKKSLYVVATCNTFHSPKIFGELIKECNSFNKTIKTKYGKIYVQHMIESTIKYIVDTLKCKNIGLMSTTGTRQTKLYPNTALSLGYNDVKIIEVGDDNQSELHDSIYNSKDGIKTLSAPSKRVRANFEKYVKQLKGKGCKVVILGCTEIPIALPEQELFDVKLVDPMTVLALKTIKDVQNWNQ